MSRTTVEDFAEADRGAVTHELPGGILVERNVSVRVRDGTRLSVTVYRPEHERPCPVVLCVTVYGKNRGPAEYSTLPKIKAAGMSVGTFFVSEVTPWEGPDPGFWVPNDYAVVVADARGYYESEGEAGLYSSEDADDYADLIEWAGTQPWSSGAVGLNGVSYLAISQWLCASQAEPTHLKAIVPWEGASDLLRDVLRPGGIPETRFLPGYYSGSLARGAGDAIVARGPAMMERAAERPFRLEAIRVPALVCASWSDHGLHTRGSIEGFTRISSAEKWLYTHGRDKWEAYYSQDALEWQRSFFDRFLKGEDNGFERRPRVRLEVRRTRADRVVRAERSWPIDGTNFERRYLDLARRRLTLEKPFEHGSLAYRASDCVSFELPFERLTEVTGPMVLALHVAALDADDADLFVAVRKFDRAGREVHFSGKDGYRDGVVALGWLRLSQRRLDPVRTLPWRPFLAHDRAEHVAPGEVVSVRVEILPSSTLFEPGETLRLDVSGRDIVAFARFGHDESVNVGRHELHGGDACASYLLVPVVS